MSEEHAFHLASGSHALDLLNTHRIQDGHLLDELPNTTALAVWLSAKGLGGSPESRDIFGSPPRAHLLLDEARDLRDDIALLLQAHQADTDVPVHVVYGINRVLGAGRTSAALRFGPGGATLTEIDAGSGPLAVLSPIARSAAELVIDAAPERIRRCASDSCHRWFLDTSRGGRRRWCSMATCGNRAKAANHRRRHAPG